MTPSVEEYSPATAPQSSSARTRSADIKHKIRHKLSFGVPVTMRNFLVVVCGAALLWFVLMMAFWTNNEDQVTRTGGLQLDESTSDKKAFHGGNSRREQEAQVQGYEAELVSRTKRSHDKLYVISSPKASSSKFAKQIRLLLDAARLQTAFVTGDEHAIVVHLIDILGNVLRGEQLLLIFTNATIYFKILCRNPTFFQNRFGETVNTLILSNVDDDELNSEPSTTASCRTFATNFVADATHVKIARQSTTDKIFRILRTTSQEDSAPATLSLYDESPMRLASFTRYNRELWKPILCISDQSVDDDCNNAVLLLPRYDNDKLANTAILAVNLNYWWSQITVFELIGYLGGVTAQLLLERYILVDIDDAFIGTEGTKMTPDDVAALLDEQKNIARMVRQFRFNIGFSGRFFHRGNAREIAGDDMLIENRDKFWWFPHMYDHMQPHLFSSAAELESRMRKNLQFARAHDITLAVPGGGYAVSPHHSGVYPTHQPLYDAWKRVYNITVTSTEQYPHLKPFGSHRGFRFQNVSVLPRQVCGLYTKTLHFSDFPGGGLAALNKSMFGGGGGASSGSIFGGGGGESLFTTLLTKPISIFMTHMLNYASGDRVALYTFREALKFITQRTTLQFRTLPPAELAGLYFEEFYPQDRDPIWSNPCDDSRHREIWSRTATSSRNNNKSLASLKHSSSSCENLPLPDAVIVGPQKTGTTALYTFLKQHPAVQSSVMNIKSVPFEEVQFFNSHQRYVDFGLDWYLKQFSSSNIEKFPPLADDKTERNYVTHPNARMLFEKSATYFDSALTPMRMHALLPRAQIIVILADPVKRAYSWYLHAKAHNDTAAVRYSFDDIVKLAVQSQNKSSSNADADDGDVVVKALRNRCIEPGKYAAHIRRWLKYYSNASQFMFVDADELEIDPVQVMRKVQTFLNLQPQVDYSKLLRYVPQKHFYCPLVVQPNNNGSRPRCLGSGKGRRVSSPSIGRKVEFSLRGFYRQHNLELLHLLRQIGKETEIPRWLADGLGAEKTADAA